jgi:hypothetical protein
VRAKRGAYIDMLRKLVADGAAGQDGKCRPTCLTDRIERCSATPSQTALEGAPREQ